MIVSIASGKGGTGKTLIATSIALSLKDNIKVQLLDCDVEEPNDHIFLKPAITNTELVSIPVPKIDLHKCTFCRKCAQICAYNAIAVLPGDVLVFKQLCHGCGACSYLCPERAIFEEMMDIGVVESGNAQGIHFTHGRLNVGEAMATPVIRKVKDQIKRDGIALIDVPPGTSCPVVESVKGSDFCILVTEPTLFGLNDLELAVDTVQTLNIPCGLILNRAGTRDVIVEEYCRKNNLPLLMKIPLDLETARLYSRGITLAEGKLEWRDKFVEVVRKVEELAGERSCSNKR
ncbi:MAG: ATP-binding protein [Dehalococcoidales bacterium]|nr:ATP-binding protein [Dehalococcoidales bacterium]